MNQQKILLITPFFDPLNENYRLNKLLNVLKTKATVHIITTNFNHKKKTAHPKNIFPKEYTFIPVPFYKKNLSFIRFFSHIVFAFKLRKHLKTLTLKPNKIYCSIPTSTAAIVAGLYAKSNKISFYVDIIDLWPKSFILLFKFKILLKIITYPWQLVFIYSLKLADKIFAESNMYAKVAKKYNKKVPCLPFYLGADPDHSEKIIQESNIIVPNNNNIKICYGGSLGYSYDFEIILQSFKKLYSNYKNIELYFIGGGIKEKEIKSFCEENNLPVYITGYLSYADYLKYLFSMDIALNSFKKDTAVAFSYKFNDYISAGLAVINNLKGETEELITTYNIGLNFDYNCNQLDKQLEKLINNKQLLNKTKENSKNLSYGILNSNNIYGKMVDEILN